MTQDASGPIQELINGCRTGRRVIDIEGLAHSFTEILRAVM
jgi:hypothetical protein